jgi:chemotaxis signal transduction protein
VSGSTRPTAIEQRLLTFEVAGGVYALPIACVVEVSEVQPLACIPTLAVGVAGVMNHHGDALPVLSGRTLLEVEADGEEDPDHILVVARRSTGGARLGMPVDRVLGLVDGAGAAARGSDPVAERRPIDGRVVSVIDPQRLVARAKEVIERSLGAGE